MLSLILSLLHCRGPSEYFALLTYEMNYTGPPVIGSRSALHYLNEILQQSSVQADLPLRAGSFFRSSFLWHFILDVILSQPVHGIYLFSSDYLKETVQYHFLHPIQYQTSYISFFSPANGKLAYRTSLLWVLT